MRRVWISILTAGVLTIAAIAPAAAQDIFSIELQDVEDSGITGLANVSSANGQTSVVITVMSGEEEGAVHPVHIHEGTCDDLGDVAYPLEDIVEGSSESVVDASMADLMTGEYAINAHMSEDDMGTNIMCGTLPAAEIGVDEGTTDDDDEAAEDDDDVVEEDDDAAVEEDDADDAEDVVPAAGSDAGSGAEIAVLLMTVLAGAAVGTGMLVRRRAQNA